MNFPVIDKRLQTLVDDFVNHQKLEVAAREREDTRRGNSEVDKIGDALDELAGSPAGRERLEVLLQHDLPEVQLRAAGRVIDWAPAKAVPVLGQLLAEWRPKDPRKGYVAVGFLAGLRLYRYFGIEDFDQNRLVEPLKAYGIDLPLRPES